MIALRPHEGVVRVDFQNSDAAGRVCLNTAGTIADLKRQNVDLNADLRLLLVDAELSTWGEVVWSDGEQMWVAEIDLGVLYS